MGVAIGGDAEILPLEEEIFVVSPDKSNELLDFDEALERLAKMDPPKARVVELRYFGGLSIEETAKVMGISVPTVNRHRKFAKAWLHSELTNN